MKGYIFHELYNRIRSKLWYKLVHLSRKYTVYPFLYSAYWNYLIKKQPFPQPTDHYYSAKPNPGAGIGHQIANWIAGFWFAKQFGLKYAHSTFFNSEWETFLGLGENEISVSILVEKGYSKVLLPLFDEFNDEEVQLQKKIIASYSNRKVVFIAEQDQGYRDQFGVKETIKEKFFNSKSRINDILFYNPQFINIAVHVRRGDIVTGEEINPNLKMRFQGNEYFTNVLTNLLNTIQSDKPIAIHLFSQGNVEKFAEFGQFENLHYCLDLSPMSSFLHMVYADFLITSKSSFSYKPALLNKGIKICPKEFWHGYPTTEDWIIADENGELSSNLIFAYE